MKMSNDNNALIVDDYKEIHAPLQAMLESEGYTVFCCNNVDDAEKILDRMPVSLIVTDLYMPDRSGFSFIRKVVHKNQEYKNPKLLAITGGGTKEMRAEVEEDDVIFADGFLKKPFNRGEFLNAVRTVMTS